VADKELTSKSRPTWLGQDNAPPEEEQEGVGGVGYLEPGEDEETSLSILQGEEMGWFFDRASGKWYVQYGLPNSSRVLVFEARPDQMNALFGVGNRPRRYTVIQNLQTWLQNGHRTFGGNIAEMEGRGSFEAEIDRVVALALDEGKLPDWLEDSASERVYDLLYIAQSEGKSDAWFLEQVSKLPEFHTRFPGISVLRDLGMDLTESIGAFLEMEQGLRTLQLQYGLSPDMVNPNKVGALLRKGYSMEQVTEAYTVFNRMRDYRPALQAFNEVLAAQGRQPLKGSALIKFLRGEAPQDVYDIYEASSLREAATAAGLGGYFSASEAIDVAMQTATDFNLQEATPYLAAAAQSILRMRHEINTEQFGLNADDLIDLALGIAPRSGTSIGEISENVERVLQEARAYINEQRATPGWRVNQQGIPQASGLEVMRPIS